VLNQRGAIEGEFIEGWEMFREDFWEEEERRIREEEERAKREGRRTSIFSIKDDKTSSGRPKTASAMGSVDKPLKKKKKSVSGSVSSVKTGSTSGGSVKKSGKKKKKTAEKAVSGL